MNRALSCLLAICLTTMSFTTFAQQHPAQSVNTQREAQQEVSPRAEYIGQLEANLVPDTSFMFGPRLKVANGSDRARLPMKLKVRDAVSVGAIAPPGYDKTPLSVALVERAGAAPQLFVDLDRNKKFSRRERFSFKKTSANRELDGELTIEIPTSPGSQFATLPLLLHLPKPSKPQSFFMLGKDMKPIEEIKPAPDASMRELHLPYGFFAVGRVDVKGRQVLVRYSYDPAKHAVDARNGLHAMDSNLDGKIDISTYSPEKAHVRDEGIVFRVGDRYLSTKSIDTATNRIVLQEHTPAEYIRIELLNGTTMPDFAFTDFDKREHRISDYRGKYLLLDFWGSWCAPCVAEIPYLKKAYEKYRERGFEIVGMNIETAGKDDKPLKTDADYAEKLIEMRDFVQKHEMLWTQATTASIRDLTRQRLRINVFPMTILLDPEGRIVSTGDGDLPLIGDELFTTLERLMKK